MNGGIEPPMDIFGLEPRSAVASDDEKIAALLCSAAKDINLAAHVCCAERRSDLVRTIQEWRTHNLVWVLGPAGAPISMITLEQDLLSRITGIAYLVVNETYRGHELGPSLIRHCQRLSGVKSLIAEARNPASERALQKCDFSRMSQEPQPKYPKYEWKL